MLGLLTNIQRNLYKRSAYPLRHLRFWPVEIQVIECWAVCIFPMPIKKAPIKYFIGAFKDKNFSLLLGFRFLSFFFSFNNGVRD